MKPSITAFPFDTEHWDEVERVQNRLVEEYIPEVTQFLDSAYAALTELDTLEEMILTAIGLSWHWDTAGTGLSPFVYRQLIRRMFEAHDEEGLSPPQATRFEPVVRRVPALALAY
jgi:hypothetical protein